MAGPILAFDHVIGGRESRVDSPLSMAIDLNERVERSGSNSAGCGV